MSLKAVDWLGAKLGLNISGRGAGQSDESAQAEGLDGQSYQQQQSGGGGAMTEVASGIGQYWNKTSQAVSNYWNKDKSSSFLGGNGGDFAGGGGGGGLFGFGGDSNATENTEIDEAGLPVSKNWYYFDKELNRWCVTPDAPESIQREFQQQLEDQENERLGLKKIAPPPPPPPPSGATHAQNAQHHGGGLFAAGSMQGGPHGRAPGPHYAVPDYFGSFNPSDASAFPNPAQAGSGGGGGMYGSYGGSSAVPSAPGGGMTSHNSSGNMALSGSGVPPPPTLPAQQLASSFPQPPLYAATTTTTKTASSPSPPCSPPLHQLTASPSPITPALAPPDAQQQPPPSSLGTAASQFPPPVQPQTMYYVNRTQSNSSAADRALQPAFPSLSTSPPPPLPQQQQQLPHWENTQPAQHACPLPPPLSGLVPTHQQHVQHHNTLAGRYAAPPSFGAPTTGPATVCAPPTQQHQHQQLSQAPLQQISLVPIAAQHGSGATTATSTAGGVYGGGTSPVSTITTTTTSTNTVTPVVPHALPVQPQQYHQPQHNNNMPYQTAPRHDDAQQQQLHYSTTTLSPTAAVAARGATPGGIPSAGSSLWSGSDVFSHAAVSNNNIFAATSQNSNSTATTDRHWGVSGQTSESSLTASTPGAGANHVVLPSQQFQQLYAPPYPMPLSSPSPQQQQAMPTMGPGCSAPMVGTSSGQATSSLPPPPPSFKPFVPI